MSQERYTHYIIMIGAYGIVADVASKKVLIVMESRLVQLYKDPMGKDKSKYEVIERFPGSKLVGLRYTPLFQYFADMAESGAFQIVSDGYVTDDRYI